MSEQPPITTTGTRVVFESRWTRLREDEIVRPNGYTGQYAVIEKPRAALVIPWDGTHLHLVRQWRYPIARWSVEFPQGTVAGPVDGLSPREDPDPEEVARLELREELGITAGALVQLGSLAFAPGISNQFSDVWLATELEHGPTELEPEEQGLLTPLTVTPAAFDELLVGGEIVDAATMAAWTMLQRSGVLDAA